MAQVIVVGSIGGDVVAITKHHPRGGETVLGSSVQFFPGGKGANQAVAAAYAGVATRIIGRIGEDPAGAEQLRSMNAAGIDTGAVRSVTSAPTQTAIIVVDEHGENTIVVIPGASGEVTADDGDAIPAAAGDVVVCQLEIPQIAVMAAFRRARSVGATTVLNAAPAALLHDGLMELTDVLVVNELEASLLLGRTLPVGAPMEFLVTAARALRAHPAQVVVLTVGHRGAVAVERDQVIEVGGRRVSVVDTTGAGDCFVGYLAAGLAEGQSLELAMHAANHAASLSVQRMGAGTSMPMRAELSAETRV